MFEKDNILNDAKSKYMNIVVPDKIDDYIKSGIEKGKSSEKSTFHKKFTATVACLALIIFVTFIRVSPTFAAYLSNVPILQHFVELINYDKGLKSAVENDFVQHIDKSDEHDGIIFTVDDVIIDEERMIIFYTTENKNDDEFFNLHVPNITDDKDNPICACICSGGDYGRDEKQPSKSHGKVTLSFGEETSIPDIFVVKASLIKSENGNFARDEKDNNVDNPDNNYQKESKNNKLNIFEGFEVAFTVDKTKFQNLKKSYEINEPIKVEGQKIKFKNVAISPTRTAIKVEFDASNTKHIFSFDDLKIIDEKNNEYPSIKGIQAALTDEFHRTLYFESNYFDNPEHLYLKGSTISALDKDKLQVKVDLKNEKLLTSPDDNLILKEIIKKNDRIGLVFEYNNFNNQYFNFNSKFEDANGNSYYSNSSAIRTHTDKNKNNDFHRVQDVIFYIDADEDYQNPIILTLANYPTKITGDFTIKIK